MDAILRFSAASLTLFFLICSARAQSQLPPEQRGTWDMGVVVTGATGEETTNSFTQAHIWTAGAFFGKVLTRELGHSWRRGSLEYGFDLLPVFAQTKIQNVHGGAFDPVIFRWNFRHHTARVLPYIELAGGAVVTPVNLPPGNTSSFNFTARGGGGTHIFTRKRESVDVGCRWSHISNANLGVRNTEFNGIQVSLAYHWFK
jgi:hypothetical protein